MKIKTSLSIEETILEKAKLLAKNDNRSTSNFLERAIEMYVASLSTGEAAFPKAYPTATRGMSLVGA